MGNRAVISITDSNEIPTANKESTPSIYLHWNGGADTIEPLLEVAKEYGLRGDDYGIARLTQMMGNVFGGILSIGVENVDKLDTDNGDNGTYVIDQKFNIVDRLYYRGDSEQRVYDFQEMKQHIKSVNDQFFLTEK